MVYRSTGDFHRPTWVFIRFAQSIVALVTVIFVVVSHRQGVEWLILFNLTPAAYSFLWIVVTFQVYFIGYLGLALLQTVMDFFIFVVVLGMTILTHTKKIDSAEQPPNLITLARVTLALSYGLAGSLLLTTYIGYRVHKAQTELIFLELLAFNKSGQLYSKDVKSSTSMSTFNRKTGKSRA